MTSPDSVLGAVSAIVQRVAGSARTPAHVGAETRLLEGFWLDSMELLEVVLACEQYFSIEFEESRDLTPESLDTLGGLARLIHARVTGAGSLP